jgi:hypothetical protein
MACIEILHWTRDPITTINSVGVLYQMSPLVAAVQAARCPNNSRWMPLLRHTQT